MALHELDRVQTDQAAHAEPDHVDLRHVELLADASQVRDEVLGRATDRREVEGPVRVREHHSTVGLESTRQRLHGPARAEEAVHEDHGRSIGPRPGHVVADLVAAHEMAGVVIAVGDRLDGFSNAVLEAPAQAHPSLIVPPSQIGPRFIDVSRSLGEAAAACSHVRAAVSTGAASACASR
jgi:hypothetical protein